MNQMNSFIHNPLFPGLSGRHDFAEVGGDAAAEEREDAVEDVFHLVGGEVHLSHIIFGRQVSTRSADIASTSVAETRPRHSQIQKTNNPIG